MRISFWLPVDFFLGMAGNRRRLLDVPLVTEERTGPRHKVVEISWNFLLSWTIIVDLKRVFLPTPIRPNLRKIQPNNTCQPITGVGRIRRRRRPDLDEAV